MSFLISLLFVAIAVTSAFLQASDNNLKKIISPALTAFSGLLVFYGALSGNVSLASGLTVSSALLLLAASDFTFERTGDNPGLFPLAMIFGIVSGFILGVLFNIVAIQADVPVFIHVGCVMFGVIMAVFVYRYLKVEPALKLAVYVYLV